MELWRKVKWLLGISLVFILIIATNLIDRDSFRRMKGSVISIYEDRLVAKDIIFDINNLIHEKELIFHNINQTSFSKKNSALNKGIDSLIINYEKTKLTEEEFIEYEKFVSNVSALKLLEEKNDSSMFSNSKEYKQLLSNIKVNLSNLSHIQLDQGKREMGYSKSVMDSVELLTKMEIYVLIGLAILLQIMVIYTPKNQKED